MVSINGHYNDFMFREREREKEKENNYLIILQIYSSMYYIIICSLFM